MRTGRRPINFRDETQCDWRSPLGQSVGLTAGPLRLVYSNQGDIARPVRLFSVPNSEAALT